MSGPQQPQVKSARLVGTLAGFGAIAGLMIVVAFQWAQPRILADRAAVLEAALHEVLAAPDSIETLFLVDGRLTPTATGVDTTKVERVFAGYDAAGTRVGYAIIGAEPGFADVVTVLFGYDPATRALLGMKVLDNRETPGLGDRIVKDTAFVGAFRGALTPLRGVKQGAGRGEPQEIDMITGATISSRVVIGIINRRLERMEPLLARYEGKQP